MKTLYDLEVGDTYWVKMPEQDIHGYFTGGITARERWLGEDDREDINDPLNCSQQLKMAIDMGIAFLTEEECQRSIDYDVALAKIKMRASELEQEVELLEDYQYIDLHESKHRGLTIHPTHYIDCAKFEKYAREKIPYKLCFDYNVCVSLIEELPEECKTVLGVE